MTPLTPAGTPPKISLGDAFGATLRAYRRAPLLYILLTLLPTLALLVLVIPLSIAAGVMAQQGTGGGAGLFGILALFPVVFILVGLYQWRCLGMNSVLTVDLLEGGGTPTLGALHTRTRGLMGRVAVLLIVVVVLGSVLAGLLLLPFLPLVSRAASGSDVSAEAVLGTAGLVVLLVLALAIVSIVLATRWLYFTPVLGVEQRSGFASLGRSWALTRGEFWRTLGFYLVASIVVGIPVWIVQMVGQFALLPDMAAGRQPSAAASIVYGLLVLVVSVLAGPVLPIFITVMYADRRRREALPATTGPYPAQPYPAQPYPGQPQPGGPQPGAPYGDPYGGPPQPAGPGGPARG